MLVNNYLKIMFEHILSYLNYVLCILSLALKIHCYCYLFFAASMNTIQDLTDGQVA